MSGARRAVSFDGAASVSSAPPAVPAGRTPWRLAVVAFAALAGVGCTNPFSPEGTDPGVYKGRSDPLFEQPADTRDAALRERFELIQNR